MPANRVINGFPSGAIINNLFVRSQIAGRDGSVVTTRATQRTNPIDGSLLANNVPATTAISLGGWPVTMYGCWGQRTNLVTRSNDFSSSWGGSNMSNASAADKFGNAANILITRTSTVASCYYQNSWGSTTAQPYTVRAFVKQGAVGTRCLVRFQTAYPNRTDAVVNLDTGTFAYGPNVFGTHSAASGKIYDAGGGWWLVTVTATADAASSAVIVSPTSIANAAAEAATGALESCYVSGVDLQAGAFPGPYIPTAGSAVTHNADQHTFALSTSATGGALIGIEVPYLWYAAPGVAHPSGQNARIWDSVDLVGRGTAINSQRADSLGGNINVTTTAPNDAHGVPQVVAQWWDGSTSVPIVNGVIGGSTATAPTPPWRARTSYTIGNTSVLTRDWGGYVGLIYDPLIQTPAQLAATCATIKSLLPASVSFAA
jgi:hypothetical protein